MMKMMQSSLKKMKPIDTGTSKARISEPSVLDIAIDNSWLRVSPSWPIKNIVAVNPLCGFEDLAFEEAVKQGKAYFQQKNLPTGMQAVNRVSIKWLQCYFDEGQSTISMPNRRAGFLSSVLSLIRFDKEIHGNDPARQQWLNTLTEDPRAIIEKVLSELGIVKQDTELFLTLLLTTLPGWAAHIVYRTCWDNEQHVYTVTKMEYLAFRLVLTYLIWPGSKELLAWHQKAMAEVDFSVLLDDIFANEIHYQSDLLKKISLKPKPLEKNRSKAQLIFCIDTRSESFRRVIELQDDYDTYGIAGFFGIPVSIRDGVTGDAYASCPVLLKPQCQVVEYPTGSIEAYQVGQQRIEKIKKIYQSIKYTFAAPFSLVEAMGLVNGMWMAIKNLFPSSASRIKTRLKALISPVSECIPDIESIPCEQKVNYALGALRIIGLTENFAPLVVLVGHGSRTENNPYASMLDCGACGGHQGASNARILAAMLNDKNVRDMLIAHGIVIPEDTLFLAGGHNTTTDEVDVQASNLSHEKNQQITALKEDLEKARVENSYRRARSLGINVERSDAKNQTALRAIDWAQVRPEWGLARNGAFIVGPRFLTKDIDLEGRVFMHSYDWEKDPDSALLAIILTAPMVVAQWINAQYLFSTLDNVAYGSGSKTTMNITGKIGVMQGNASDLMNGLPLESVYQSDNVPYHAPARLTVIVYAPKTSIMKIIQAHSVLQKLFGNGWVHLICFDPSLNKKFILQRDLTWTA